MTDLAVLGIEIRSQGVVEATRSLDALEASADRVTRAISWLEQLPQGMTRAGAALDATSRAATGTAAALERAREASGRLTSSATTGDRLAQGFDKAKKAAEDFERAAGRAVAPQAATPNVLPPPAAPPGPNNDNRRGLAAYQKQNLSYQAFDIFTQAGAGAPAGLIAVQQGPQILQSLMASEGGLRGGLKDLGATALSLVTPFSVATTAVVGFGAAYTAAAISAGADRQKLEAATLGVGRASGETAGSLDAFARSNAEAGRVSTSTAREIVAAFNQTGEISSTVYGTLIASTQRFADLTSQDVPAAAAELARMFSDPARGAEDLAGKIGGLDDRTRQLIQTQQEQGDKSAAQETLAAALKAQIDANAASTTGWAAAWNTVSTAADKAWEALKRAAGAATGLAPESAQSTLDRLNARIETTNNNRRQFGQEPLGLGSELIRERDAAAIIADTERREAAARAAEERANKASSTAGSIARNIDPQTAAFSRLRQQQSDLRDALSDPLARSKLGDLGQTEQAYTSVTRAITSMSDATGRMISVEDMAREKDRLRIDSLRAKTDAEKTSVAERQAAFDLIGRTITPSDARGRVERAGTISGIEAAGKGGGGGTADRLDEFDRALKRSEDQTRRADEQATTYGMGAAAAARYRTETELLVAAKRAEREVTPELSAQIQEYANKAGEAAGRQEALRESMRDMDSLRGGARDVTGGLFRDFNRGASAADAMANAVGRIRDRLTDLATDSIVDSLFGKRGTASGLLSSVGGAGGGGGFLSDALGWLTGSKSFLGFSGGGPVSGPGSSTSDSILARLSHGEFVVRADRAASHRGLLEQINGPGLTGFTFGGGVDLLRNAAPSGGKGGPMICRMA